jgi:hypothetical protein
MSEVDLTEPDVVPLDGDQVTKDDPALANAAPVPEPRPEGLQPPGPFWVRRPAYFYSLSCRGSTCRRLSPTYYARPWWPGLAGDPPWSLPTDDPSVGPLEQCETVILSQLPPQRAYDTQAHLSTCGITTPGTPPPGTPRGVPPAGPS